VVENINLAIPTGQFAALIGPVASGKSTLLKGLLGEVPVASGYTHLTRQRLSWCEQSPWLTVSMLFSALFFERSFMLYWLQH